MPSQAKGLYYYRLISFRSAKISSRPFDVQLSKAGTLSCQHSDNGETTGLRQVVAVGSGDFLDQPVRA